MREALNDLMRLEAAVLRFKSHFEGELNPFRGWTIPMPQARRVRAAVREIGSMGMHLDQVVMACASERPFSCTAFDDGRTFVCPSCGKEYVVDVRQVFYRDNPEDRGVEKKYELFCDCVEHDSLRDDERELVRLKPKEN